MINYDKSGTSDNVEKIDNCGKNDGNDSSENNGRSHTHTQIQNIPSARITNIISVNNA